MKISNIDKQFIKEAIANAEQHTSGEIVPVIMSKSDFYPAAHFRLAMLVGIFCSILTYNLYDFDDPILLIMVQLPGMIVGYFLAYIPYCKRFFSSKSEMTEEVYQKAIQTYYENKVSMTKDRTGIMIFVSLLEHRVEVLADCGINEKVKQGHWEKIVSALILNIKNKKLVNGMVEAIDSCGKNLVAEFPRQEDDMNEITDELISDL